jgi:prepilin-type N-terminal cleavage/methylation domain-containing protein
VTLLELVVALAILGLILGVSGLALASLRPPAASEVTRVRQQARAEAIRTGTAVRADSVLFLPDGRALGPGVDPLTGAVRAPR